MFWGNNTVKMKQPRKWVFERAKDVPEYKPAIGEYFYDVQKQELKIYDGTQWEVVKQV